jgi:hypothetical protein
MLRIIGPQNPAKVEEELRRVVAAPGDSLLLPVHPKEWWLGGELGLIELAITWARVSEQGALVTYIGPDENPKIQLGGMAKRLFGFVALMMAPEILDREANPARSLRPEAYDECRQVVEMMFQPVREFALGAKLFLVCVDHSSRWMIPWLYAPNETVGDRIAFITLARELITKISATYSKYSIPPLAVTQIGAILHELFKNTDEWARSDNAGIPWRRSVRGIAGERHTWSAAKLDEIAADNPALKAYFDQLSSREPDKRLRFLEFSVFDSGSGLARRWLSDLWSPEISLADEHTACLKCLTKHQTSSHRRDKGRGLTEVMSTLATLDGFLKIRTGRLSLYRDFVNLPLQPGGGDVELRDFPTCSTTLTELASIFGTHFQFLIPIYR